MGDENSMAGQTKAHKHSALSSDGGFLETTVTGVTNLSQGSIVYGDASEIVTELTAGSDGDALQISSGVPAWVTGSAGASGWEFVEEFVLGSTTVYFDCVLASAIDLADYNVLCQWWIKNDSISSNMEMVFNGQTGAGGQVFISGNTAQQGMVCSGFVQIPADSWCIGNFIYYGNTQDTSTTLGFFDCSHGTTSSGNLSGTPYRGNFRLQGATTEINAVKFFPTNGNQYINNYVRFYKMATS
jgi:hypothetical protein